MMIIFKRIGLGLIFLCFQGSVFACECDTEGFPSKAIEQADLIFKGKVIDVNTNWISGGWKVSFAVETTWKSRVDSFLMLNSEWKKDCGIEFKLGQEYLVYAHRKYNSYETGQCTGTKLISESTTDLGLLGEGNSPSPSTSGRLMGILLAIAGVGALLLVGFIVLGNRKKKRYE